MPSALLERLPRALKRTLLVVAALAVVALSATACLPPADTATRPPATPPQATIVHCPVEGFTYSQGFGPTHSGVDMGAPYGSNVYAVRNGTLWYWSTGDVGGYSVYLKADDGNTYYYTHLRPYASALENTTRPVQAGDVIEFVDHTGNANGYDHLHFELRLGGPNGTRVDPRPTLDAAGCA
jgi:murein DD-endopeptidase MepM/ murein hydrolase activator NlpD